MNATGHNRIEAERVFNFLRAIIHLRLAFLVTIVTRTVCWSGMFGKVRESKSGDANLAFITLTEYAKRNGKDQGNVSRKYKNGDFKTAFRHGKIVLIDEDEPWSDKRLINGRYVDFRKNLKVGKSENLESQKFLEVSENGKESGSD